MRNIQIELFLFVFFYAILFFYVRRDRLNNKELEYLEKNAELKLENRKNKLVDYLLLLLMLFAQFYYITYTAHPVEFMINTILIVGIAIFVGYNHFNQGNFSTEKLYCTNTQVVYIGHFQTVVVDIVHVQEISQKENYLVLKEKYGQLKVDIKNASSEKLEKLMATIKDKIDN